MKLRLFLLIVIASVLVLTTVIFTSFIRITPESPVISVSAQQEAEQLSLSPHFTDTTNPENFGVEWEICANGSIVESFIREDAISFGQAEDYYTFNGVSTFRGNNYRNSPVFGTTEVSEGKLEAIWNHSIGRLDTWSGCGWTGQPLIVKWENETKEIMNIYPDKKAKDGLTEVIYATLDGNIYFYDLEDGEPTRDKLVIGMPFKGTGTLDPRGYPIMYIGSGIAMGGKSQRMYAINLIDNTVIYEQSGTDPFAYRGWAAFDSSPIIDAETDTLIWPGENGVLYTVKLNTVYNPTEGTISINPENIAKCRYRTSLTNRGRWLGFESSCAVVGNYVFLSENSGMFFCVDLNTMELVWAQDVLDDTNSSPVFEWDKDGNGYVYTAPALRWTAEGGRGSTTIFKLDANTGEIIWDATYDCVRLSDENSGGVQSTPAIGKIGTDMENLIIYNIASSPSRYEGRLIAFDKENGEVVWEHHMQSYTWSSPVITYTEDGKGYVIICDSIGNVKLINGADGVMIDSVNIGSNVESSPAIYEDTLVVGTRGCKIFAIKIK